MLMVLPGRVTASSWRTPQLLLATVSFTCDLTPPPSTQGSPFNGQNGMGPMQRMLACAVGHAGQWQDVVAVSAGLQSVAPLVLVVLDKSLMIPGDASASSIPIYREVVVMANPETQARTNRMTYVSMDPLNGKNAWIIMRPGNLTFMSLVLQDLPMVGLLPS
ncbi:hypothetical protein HaLaN_24781 [Haematococcus lacustris]|uniref:Uncharacterized protein n=1 Tax=Haematococcus lacustris TaxID=44745 RepID=A0A699ZX77_HAELA|nr:hypothetical protein HaLaN_24781 [Haematococcus lacustris]